MSSEKNIYIYKIHHRGSDRLAIQFSHDEKTRDLIMSLSGIRFSITNSCYYLPFNANSLLSLKNTGLNIYTRGPMPKDISTRPSSTSSEKADIDESSSPPASQSKVRGKSDEAIADPAEGLRQITWQGGHFFVDIKYSERETDYLKSLYGSYWHSKQKVWVCKGNVDNLKSLQNRYKFWDQRSYYNLKHLANKYPNRSKVVIKTIPKKPSKLEVRIANASAAIDYIKQVPGREYLQEQKLWLIPKDINIVNRIREFCKSKGYTFQQHVSWKVHAPIEKTKDGDRKLKRILSGITDDHRDLMTRYANVFLRENYSYNTMKQYCGAFQAFVYACGGESVIKHMDIEDVQLYIDSIVNRKVSYQELNRHISAIKFYYQKMCGWHEIRLNNITRPKRPKTLPKIMSIKEVKRLMDQVKNPKHLCMLYLAYGCGLRSGEILHLKLKDLMLDRKQLFVRSGKGNKDRVLMIPETLYPLLTKYIDQYRPDYWLFSGQQRGKPYSRSSLRTIFKRACKAAGLDKSHKLHNLRHSFATHLMESGTQQRLIQKLLGHKSSKTTEIYTHVSKQSLNKIISPLDRMDDNKNE